MVGSRLKSRRKRLAERMFASAAKASIGLSSQSLNDDVKTRQTASTLLRVFGNQSERIEKSLEKARYCPVFDNDRTRDGGPRKAAFQPPRSDDWLPARSRSWCPHGVHR
jgi:hypothetical protein